MYLVKWFDEKHQKAQVLTYPNLPSASLVASALHFAMGIEVTVFDSYRVLVCHEKITEVHFPV